MPCRPDPPTLFPACCPAVGVCRAVGRLQTLSRLTLGHSRGLGCQTQVVLGCTEAACSYSRSHIFLTSLGHNRVAFPHQKARKEGPGRMWALEGRQEAAMWASAISWPWSVEWGSRGEALPVSAGAWAGSQGCAPPGHGLGQTSGLGLSGSLAEPDIQARPQGRHGRVKAQPLVSG